MSMLGQDEWLLSLPALMLKALFNVESSLRGSAVLA